MVNISFSGADICIHIWAQRKYCWKSHLRQFQHAMHVTAWAVDLLPNTSRLPSLLQTKTITIHQMFLKCSIVSRKSQTAHVFVKRQTLQTYAVTSQAVILMLHTLVNPVQYTEHVYFMVLHAQPDPFIHFDNISILKAESCKYIKRYTVWNTFEHLRATFQHIWLFMLFSMRQNILLLIYEQFSSIDVCSTGNMGGLNNTVSISRNKTMTHSTFQL